MRLAFKYRIYPNKEQLRKLEDVFWFCRFLYNSALQERIERYKQTGKTITYSQQCTELADVKWYFPNETAAIYSQTLQQILKQLDSSYQNFFRRCNSGSGKAGFPRYKGTDRFRSILFPQCNLITGGVKRLANDKLQIYGIPGEIKAVWHRPIQGRCKTVRICKQSGKWFLIASCDDVPKNILPVTGNTIGIDMGLNSFITTDTGKKHIANKPYHTAKQKLAYWNRQLATKKRGSNNRKRAKHQLNKVYEKITNVRNDSQHKLAKQLITENDVIIVEKLNIQKMMTSKNHTVKKENITDASWGNFRALLTYKAERAGRKVIEVNPAGTSKTCSCCGNLKELTLADRVYHCGSCGLDMDRDQNAALNIRRLGLSLAAKTLQVVGSRSRRL
jgi:putative transposase